MNETLPSYADLQKESEEKSQSLTGLTEEKCIELYLKLVNNPCPEAWLKKVKVGGGRQIKYLPIDKVQFLLTKIYSVFWRREILEEKLILNSVCVRTRLHYKIPGTSIWMFQDGAGGAPVNVSAGEPASNMSAIYLNSVQTAYPAAASYSLSNASEKIGTLFGLNLNKDDAMPYEGTVDMANEFQKENLLQAKPEPKVTVILPPSVREVENTQTKSSGFKFEF